MNLIKISFQNYLGLIYYLLKIFTEFLIYLKKKLALILHTFIFLGFLDFLLGSK